MNCETKKCFHDALRGVGLRLTKARISCKDWMKDFLPGTRVGVVLTFVRPRDDIYRFWFTGTVMGPAAGKPGKVRVWLDYKDGDGLRPKCLSPALTVKRLRLLNEPPIQVCGYCHKPANKANEQFPCHQCESERFGDIAL